MLPTLMPWAPDNGGEHRAGSIISGKPGLHHSRPIVAHEGRHFSVVSHCTLQTSMSCSKTYWHHTENYCQQVNKLSCSRQQTGLRPCCSQAGLQHLYSTLRPGVRCGGGHISHKKTSQRSRTRHTRFSGAVLTCLFEISLSFLQFFDAGFKRCYALLQVLVAELACLRRRM